MRISLTAPCCLTLAAGRLDGAPVLLGVALRHPPVQLEARPAPALEVTGARADAAYAHAARLAAAHGVGATVEIELAVPSHMGLGSRAMAGLAAARALAALHDLPAANLAATAGLAPDDGLAAHAFTVGGLLAVGRDGALLRRAALPSADEATDWVFVFHLPRVPPGTLDDLEDVRRRALWDAAEASGDASERLTRALWDAAAAAQLGPFAEALAALQALAPTPELTAEEGAALAVIRAGGALAWGRAPAGLARYGLIQGAEPSRELRRALSAHVGPMGGIVMATICDSAGAQIRP